MTDPDRKQPRHHRAKIPKSPTNKPGKIDLSKAIELRYKHRHSYRQIAEYFGVDHSAVIQRIQSFEAMLGDPDKLEAFRSHEAQVQDAIRSRFSAHLLTADLEKCSPRDAAIVYGTIYDKNRLQTGQSTANLAQLFARAMETDNE